MPRTWIFFILKKNKILQYCIKSRIRVSWIAGPLKSVDEILTFCIMVIGAADEWTNLFLLSDVKKLNDIFGR